MNIHFCGGHYIIHKIDTLTFFPWRSGQLPSSLFVCLSVFSIPFRGVDVIFTSNKPIHDKKVAMPFPDITKQRRINVLKCDVFQSQNIFSDSHWLREHVCNFRSWMVFHYPFLRVHLWIFILIYIFLCILCHFKHLVFVASNSVVSLKLFVTFVWLTSKMSILIDFSLFFMHLYIWLLKINCSLQHF